MPRSPRPNCARCGMGVPGAFDAVLTCAACRRRPLAFEAARAPWQYEGAMRDAVRLFKYEHRWRIGQWLAHEMSACASQRLPLDRIDVILPVPFHWLKHRFRDFNPAAQLALAVATRLQKPYEPSSLRRPRWTSTQTALTWQARRRNVRGSFAAKAKTVRERTILLIDDVLTSGATAHACTLALKDAGARAVFVLTAARTPLAQYHEGARGEGRGAREKHFSFPSHAPCPMPHAPS